VAETGTDPQQISIAPAWVGEGSAAFRVGRGPRYCARPQVDVGSAWLVRGRPPSGGRMVDWRRSVAAGRLRREADRGRTYRHRWTL